MEMFAAMLAAADREHPVRLSDLVRQVDWKQRVVPDRQELENIVWSLIRERVASHLGGERFVAFSAALPEIPFEGISEARFREVQAEYAAEGVAAREAIADRERRIRTGDVGEVLRRTFPDALEAQVAAAWITARPVGPGALTRTATLGSLGFDHDRQFSVVLALASVLELALDEVRALAAPDQTVVSMAARLRRLIRR
jgi:hypothetical protein